MGWEVRDGPDGPELVPGVMSRQGGKGGARGPGRQSAGRTRGGPDKGGPAKGGGREGGPRAAAARAVAAAPGARCRSRGPRRARDRAVRRAVRPRGDAPPRPGRGAGHLRHPSRRGGAARPPEGPSDLGDREGRLARARCSVVGAEEIEERAGSDAHQGVAALVDPYPYADAAEFPDGPRPADRRARRGHRPAEPGAIARTAEAVGATGIVIPERRSAEVTPAVCKASAGAVEHLPIAQVRNLADFLAEAKEEGCWVYGAAAGARTRYDQPDYKGGVVAVLGAEGKGLRQRVASMCDDLVSLPLRGKIESLNVSATARRAAVRDLAAAT